MRPKASMASATIRRASAAIARWACIVVNETGIAAATWTSRVVSRFRATASTDVPPRKACSVAPSMPLDARHAPSPTQRYVRDAGTVEARATLALL
jgi:hypothetical protein